MRRPKVISLGALAVAFFVPGLAAAQNAPSLRLYSDTGLAGDVLRIDRGVSNLDDLNFNDAAHSLIAEGRWEICLDAGHAGACRVVQGQITDMGDWNGSISSARYLGPGDWGSASVGGPAGGPAQGADGAAPFSPTYRVDYRPELIGRVYDTDFGQMTVERYDRDGAAGRYAGRAADGSDSGVFDGAVRPADHTGDGYDTVEGYWYQAHASQRCGSPRNGTHYWGRVQLNFMRDTDEFIGFYSHCDGTPLDRWNGTYSHRDPAMAAAVDAQNRTGGGRVTGPQTAGARPGVPGGVDAQGRPLPGAVSRAADAAADEVERQIHDRIREGIGRIF